MSRLRSVVVLIALVVLVALLAGLALLDPFHLRQARWFTSGLIGLLLILLTIAVAVVTRRGLLRGLVILVGLVAVLGWGGFVLGASGLSGTNTEMSRVTGDGPNSGRNLVVLRSTGSTVDPVFAVVLRAGGGPFEQESLVYQGPESAPQPSTRFLDGRTVEVTLGGCRYSSTVEAVTLAAEPVHRPLLAGQC